MHSFRCDRSTQVFKRVQLLAVDFVDHIAGHQAGIGAREFSRNRSYHNAAQPPRFSDDAAHLFIQSEGQNSQLPHQIVIVVGKLRQVFG